LYEFIQNFFISQLENNVPLTVIEETDILHWCELSVYKDNKDYMDKLVELDRGGMF